MTRPPDPDAIVDSIAGSRKYRQLALPTIRRAVRRAAEASPRDVAKRARRDLHHVLAAYHVTGFSQRAVAELTERVAAGASDGEVRDRCRAILGSHATSRERMPLLDQGYYERIFSVTGRPRSVVDLAAALHPFELRWMGLAGAMYLAYDNNATFVDAAGRYLRSEGAGDAEVRDVDIDPPIVRADLAFFLMTYHCAERHRAGSGWDIVRAAPTDWIAVSFPVQSLGARENTWFAELATDFEARLAADGLAHELHLWDTERLYVVRLAR